MSKLYKGADRIQGLDKNLWVEFSKLARENNAVNVGQGFPDFEAHSNIKKGMTLVGQSEDPMMYQYTRSPGNPRLVTALAQLYGKTRERTLDPLTEIFISVGAYNSLFNAFQAFVNPGDEVIIIEPFFDCYLPMTSVCGGVPRFVPLRPDRKAQWTLDMQELAGLFNDRTKMIVVNTPHNPTGKVFTRHELQCIADLCIKHDVLCLSDEVYEFIVYSPHQHISISTLPGMFERTITVGSAGKAFSVTGVKVGWSIGPADLISKLQTVNQMCIYTAPTMTQEAVAYALEMEMLKEKPFDDLLEVLAEKKDTVLGIFDDVGMSAHPPEGGYFVMVDTTKLRVDLSSEDQSERKDYQLVKWLIKQKKLATIPPSAFYSEAHKHLGEQFLRICFCKQDSTFVSMKKILKDWLQ